MTQLTQVFKISEVADYMGPKWDVQRTRRFLDGAGALIRNPGQRPYTTGPLLRKQAPAIWEVIVAAQLAARHRG